MKKKWILILLAVALLLMPLTALARELPKLDELIPVGPCSKGHDFKLTTKSKSTCTYAGMVEMKCTRCGTVSDTQRTAPLGHDWNAVSGNGATCTTDGVEDQKCTRCGETRRITTAAAKGHDWHKVGGQDPICDKDGWTEYQCTRCGESKKETLPSKGMKHYWVLDNINRDDVECVADGTAYYHCNICHSQKNEPVYATGHKWQAVAATAATCQSAKVVTYKCSKCNDTKTETEGSKADHSWVQTYFEPATCAAEGYKSFECGFCKTTKMDTLPATGKCTWGNWIVATQATCTQDGLKVAQCSVCGDTKKETIPSEGVHDYRTQDSKSATCTTDGYKKYECSKCHKEKTETLKATGHNLGSATVITAATCTAEGKSEAVCKTCGAKETSTIKKTAHSWGEWKVTKEATETATGTRERTCKNCSAKETDTIPKKGAKPTATPKPTKKPSASSKSTAKLEAEYGTVEVFTTSAKVNLRSGAGSNNGRVTQVEKRNTCLGELLDAKADKKGVVWFKVKYKNKTGWITSDFSKAVVGELDGRIRRIEGKETELTNFYLRSVGEAVDTLELEEDYRYDNYETEASNEAVFLCGDDYVQSIELTGEGYTVYGVKIGNKIKDAKAKFTKAKLVLADDGAEEIMYNVICSQNSLGIDEYGFDGKLTVVISDNKVESMLLEANAPEEE